jgi:hypothetical protein
LNVDKATHTLGSIDQPALKTSLRADDPNACKYATQNAQQLTLALCTQTTANDACVYVCFLQAVNFKYLDIYEKDK